MEKGDLVLKTDLELVECVRKGERAAFSQLVKRHQKALLRLSLRFVKELSMAEDIVQESFIKAYEKINMFEGRSSFKSWLFQIAVNNARNRLREHRNHFVNFEAIQIAVPSHMEKRLIDASVAGILQAEVEKLPFKQRTALVLRVYEDMSFAEIADVMDCPYDTAKANYRHALLRLRDTFESRADLREATNEAFNQFSDLPKLMEAEG